MSQPQIDPSIYDDILTGGQQVGELDPKIAYAQKLAESLRAAGMKSPETRMSGRRAVAPSGMELLGNLAMQGVGNSRANEAMGYQQQQQALRMQQVQKVLQALRAQHAQQVPYQSPPQFDDPQFPNAAGAM